VNCPKCGYSQEERLDCKKCGVVFSKYYALHPEAAAAAANESESHGPTGAAVSDQLDAQEVAEFRQHLKDLNRVLNEFEFERAERNRIRGEIKVLDQKLQDVHKEVSDRLAALEKRSAASPAPEGSEPSPRLGEVESRLAELERSIGSLRANPAPSATGSIAVEFDTLFKEIDDLRTSLQNVSVRYSEIGELKKNFLVLTNRIDTLGPEIESAKESSSKSSASKKITGLEQEVTALRAELRQAIEQAGSGNNDIQGLMTRLDKISESVASSESQVKIELGNLSGKLSEGMSDFASIREEVRQKIDESSEKLRQLDEKLTALANQPPPDPQSLLEADVRAIRANLDALFKRLTQAPE
jgi:chromosome segregation ATPase